MTEKIHTARCIGGNIVIEAIGPARYTEHCHCKWCQRVSGAAFLTFAIFDEDKVRVTSGELSQYHSSEECSRGYCKDCGSSLTFHSSGNFDILIGAFDDPEPFKAQHHIWHKRRIKHMHIEDDLPRYNESDS